MSSEELLEACEDSCLDDGLVSTSIYVKDNSASEVGFENSSELKNGTTSEIGFDPPKTPNTILTKDELNPTTSSIYINDGQVKPT